MAAVDVPEKFWSLSATGWTALGSIISALSVLALSIFNALFLISARRSARASEAQARAANDALALSRESNSIALSGSQQHQRPWVGLAVTPSVFVVNAMNLAPPAIEVGPVKIDKDGTASATYWVRFKNYGESPAQSVLVRASLMVTEDLKDIEAEQLNLTKPNQDKSIGQLVFAGGVAGWGPHLYSPAHG
ncbi:MAG TPA: hypothetical protein VKB38_04535 [Terracidiphilus sp.]|nr:hypothetical protein [Terracidiphilus sp.]